MPSSTDNVKLGVCLVTFDGVDLGYTQGGVEVMVATETKKVMVDQFGHSEINEFIMGRTCHAKIPLAETTLENLARIMPGATLVTAGGTKATGTVTFSTAAPVNGDKVTVNGVDFTFKTTPAGPHDMAIPASVNASATALRDAINNSIDTRVSEITATASSAVVTLTADEEGVYGNAVTLTKTFVTGGNCTVSGATLASGADPTQKKVTVPHAIGTSLLASAKKLVLHPQSLVATNRSEDFVIPLANTSGAMNFSYKIDQERTFPVEFSAYPDPVTRVLFIYGDEATVES